MRRVPSVRRDHADHVLAHALPAMAERARGEEVADDLDHPHGLVEVEPARRRAGARVLADHALEEERHALGGQPLPAEARVDQHAVGTALELVLVEQPVGQRE